MSGHSPLHQLLRGGSRIAGWLLGCVLGLLAAAGPAGAQSPAAPASAFLASLGVNIHASQGYDYRKYVPALRYLGVRAVRDAAGNLAALVALHQRTGVLVDIFNAGDLQQLLGAGRTLAAAGALLSLEGPNEPNNFPITYRGLRGGGAGSWMAVALFQRDLYAGVKLDEMLRAYPVFHVSEAGAEEDDVGLQWLTIPPGAAVALPAGTAYADYANVHNYVIGNCRILVDNQAWQAADPVLDSCWDGLFGEYGRTWRRHFPGYPAMRLPALPRVTTETGWDSVADPGGEAMQGKVLVNTYLAQYARGWRYTFLYELGEGEGGGGHQGLFHKDWSPKLAATYIHNLTSILADAGSPPIPGTLDYAIPDKPVTVHDFLLQKSGGTFALVVWSERVRGGETAVIRLGRPAAAAKIYDLASGPAPVRIVTNSARFALALDGHAWIVEIMP